jgi:hypothetical protein
MPMGVMLLGKDLRVLSLNQWAQKSLGSVEIDVLGHGPGKALRCAYAVEAEQGCGSGAACGGCVVRDSALRALQGETVSQREVRVTARAGNAEEQKILLLSAASFRFDEQEMAVVLLQDITALHRLRGLVPICAGCKKIRRDDSAWEALEVFIEQHSHAEFTHSLCPECLRRYYPDHRRAR